MTATNLLCANALLWSIYLKNLLEKNEIKPNSKLLKVDEEFDKCTDMD